MIEYENLIRCKTFSCNNPTDFCDHSQKPLGNQHRLLLGPWNHSGEENISPINGGLAKFDLSGELLKFFDFHVKGLPTGIDREKRVHYFTLVEEQWKQADSWPPPARPLIYYLGPDQSLAAERPTSAGLVYRYQVDPECGTGIRTRWNSQMGFPIVPAYPDRANPVPDFTRLCQATASNGSMRNR